MQTPEPAAGRQPPNFIHASGTFDLGPSTRRFWPVPVNFTPARNGLVAAICVCCGRRSLPVPPNSGGEPDLWKMAQGWSEAPYPSDFTHRDGSVGSMYHCPLATSGCAMARRCSNAPT